MRAKLPQLGDARYGAACLLPCSRSTKKSFAVANSEDDVPTRGQFQHSVHRVADRLRARWTRGGAASAFSAFQVRRLITASGLFDAEWYRRRNADLAEVADVLQHYIDFGAREGRAASVAFDTAAYLAENEDVARSSVNPLVHYIRFGAAEGRPRPEVATRGAGESRPRPAGPANAASERALVESSGLFDAAWYSAQVPGLDPSSALQHYLEIGREKNLAPSSAFDPEFYLLQNEDVRAAGVDPLVHYIRFGASEARVPRLDPAHAKAVARVLDDVAYLEPDVMSEDLFADVRKLSFRSARLTEIPLVEAWQWLFDSLEKPYDYIVCVPWLTRGGADLVSVNAMRALAARHGTDAVLYLVTDYANMEARAWLPEGAHVRVFSEFDCHMTLEIRVRLVELLISTLGPRSVVNVNSRACWEAVARSGSALSSMTNLYAFLFCRDYTPDGRAAGYADTHFRSTLPHHTKVYFDNATFQRQLTEELSIPASLQTRLCALYQPTFDGTSPKRTRMRGTGPMRVLWAGRFCRQKNVDLLIEIARGLPDFEFDVHGIGDSASTAKLEAAERTLPNMRLHGPFTSFESLPTNEYDVYLYTSLWDGIPTVIINAAALEIPIVASDVGGISELVDQETGWLVREYRDAAPYVAALTEIRDDRGAAERRASRMRERAEQRHSWPSYLASLDIAPSFLQ